MDEMRDSTRFAVDAAGLREEIATYGYALIRGLVPADDALGLEEQIRRMMAVRGWTSLENSRERVLRTPIKGAEHDDYWELYSAVLASETFNALAWQPRLRKTVTTLLGPTAYVHPMKIARLVFPAAGGGIAIPVHRDNRGGAWVRDMFTTWVALGHIDSALGGMAVLQGSQTYRYPPVRERGAPPPEPGEIAIPDDSSSDWVGTEFQPGDVVIFHCYTTHKGITNHSDRVRVSVDYRWMSTEHPVHISSLLPYHYFDQYPHIPGWRELSAGWSDPRWCQYPAGTPICYKKWPDGPDDQLIPPSDFVTVPPGTHEAWRPDVKDDSSFSLPHELPPTYPEDPPVWTGASSDRLTSQ
jgi:ectoine hydroxylase-related dioxygenase (phytanoyl-CoA dioxygenase family)